MEPAIEARRSPRMMLGTTKGLVATLVLTLFALSACSFPSDMRGTSDEIRGTVMVVGVIGSDKAGPRESEIINRIADHYNARVMWVTGEAHRLVSDLEQGKIHLLAGAIPQSTPFGRKIGLSRPLAYTIIGGDRHKTVLAVRKGENAFLLQVNRAIGTSP
ncbi:hypothetical protein [Nitratireductor basaltis]|nr:hypothetical protein [Nitratireductor basaltis]